MTIFVTENEYREKIQIKQKLNTSWKQQLD